MDLMANYQNLEIFSGRLLDPVLKYYFGVKSDCCVEFILNDGPRDEPSILQNVLEVSSKYLRFSIDEEEVNFLLFYLYRNS